MGISEVPADIKTGAFLADAQRCPRCGARMPWVAALTDPDSLRTYLTGVGLPAESPAIAPLRPPPQQAFDFGC